MTSSQVVVTRTLRAPLEPPSQPVVVRARKRPRVGTSGDAVRIVQVFAITLMVIPSDVVLKAIGAAGYVASLVALFGFAVYWSSVILGFRDHHAGRNPVRAALTLLWIVTLVSYAYSHSIIELTPAQSLAGDRWIMQLMGVAGIIHLAGVSSMMLCE